MSSPTQPAGVLPSPRSAPVFERFGKAYHLKIETVEDLRRVLELDPAHWVAVSAPVPTFNSDPVFLARLDANGDGQIRAEEVCVAIKKLLGWLRDTEGVRRGNETLALDVLDLEAPEGKLIKKTARKILRRLGKSGEDTLTLAQLRRVKAEEKKRGLSEAGLVLPEAATEDPPLKTFLEDVIATVGGAPHSEGAQAVSEEKLATFLEQTKMYLEWQARAAPTEGNPVMPFGADTPAAYAAYDAVDEKITQYFTLADAVRLDASLAPHLWPGEERLAEIDFLDTEALAAFLDAAPLARPRADGTLDLGATVNPRYAEALARFEAEVLARRFDAPVERLTRAQWKTVQQTFAAHAAWRAERPAVAVDTLPTERLRTYLDDPRFADDTNALIERSHTAAVELDDVRLVEEAILYQAHLIPFVNSFVSFPQLYDPEARALFEMGTLVMDGRHFTLAVRVTDRARHAKMSNESNMFVLYLNVREKIDAEGMELAVPVTSGGQGNLQVGKRGVFYDLDGEERHAEVVQLVENPISLQEAVLGPFRRLGEAVGHLVERISAEREAELLEKGQAAAATGIDTATLPGSQTSQTSTEKAGAGGGFGGGGGILAGGGLALAALGSSLAFITKTLQGLSGMTILTGVVGIVLAVFVPVVAAAYLKLRRRDLSAILEGSGWAINARMRLTRSQAHTFTFSPAYPANARGIRFHGWWWVGLIVVLVVAAAALFYFLR